jgi:glutamate carboxypeptidase
MLTQLRLAVLLVCLLPSLAIAQTNDVVRARVRQERQPLLETLEALVSIESGSSDVEGMARIGALVGDRLRALGGVVEMVPPAADMPRFLSTPQQLGDTVVARFRGRGTTRILLLAHMDTVYQRGMLAQQPFRIEGDRAYGLGIADDKQGVALIIHALSTLKALNFDAYGLITVLISPDEEIGSVAERALITSLGAEHDLTLSFEGGLQDDALRLATTGVGVAILTVKGRASHAGVAPEQGRNALYEMSHQIMQMRDLSEPDRGVKMNWTVATAGSVFNAIPADARAIADLRVDRVSDFDALEDKIRTRIRAQLIPDTAVDVRFEHIYPPMPLREASRGAAAHAQEIYREMDRPLKVFTTSPGGGTDAAFAALQSSAPILEGLGLQTFGAHSSDAEYVNIPSIEPRLYLATRLIMDASNGKMAVGPR